MFHEHDHEPCDSTNENGHHERCDCPACAPDGCDDDSPLAWFASLGDGFAEVTS